MRKFIVIALSFFAVASVIYLACTRKQNSETNTPTSNLDLKTGKNFH